MYPTSYLDRISDRISAFRLPEVPAPSIPGLPTFERRLDQYFDEHFEEIIAEWGLLTQRELRDLEQRLEHVSAEIETLNAKQKTAAERARTLETEIKKLEGSR